MDFITSIDNVMNQAVFDAVFPGAVLLVSQKNRIHIHRAYGLANIFTQRPMTLNTIFDLASLTKPLATTLAVMKLVDDQRLEMKNTLGDLIPEFRSTDKESISLKMLFAHTSGYPDYRPYYTEIGRASCRERVCHRV